MVCYTSSRAPAAQWIRASDYRFRLRDIGIEGKNMRIPRKRVIGYTLAVTTLVVGILAALIVHRISDPSVYVTLKNSSGQNIRLVRLIHGQGNIIVRNLKQDESRQVKFSADGEGSFSLDVEFKNRNRIQDSGGYVEPGYRMTVFIHRNDFSTRYDSLY
jgi:hypothetical protein